MRLKKTPARAPGAQSQDAGSWGKEGRFGHLCASFVVVLFFSFVDIANGQTIKFSGLAVPASESLRHDPNPFFIFGSSVSFVVPNAAVGKRNTVTIKNLRLSEASTQEIQQVVKHDVYSASAGNSRGEELLMISPAGIEVALIKYRQLKRMLTESAPVPFCCHGMPFSARQPFVPTAECPYPNALRRFFWSSRSLLPSGSPQHTPKPEVGQVPIYDGEEVYVRPVALAGTPEANEEISFVVRDSDIYFLVTANCGPLSDLTFDGEVQVSNAYGMLPGYEYSGLLCDLVCVVAYCLLTLVWGLCLFRERKNLIKFHYCLGAVCLLGLFESGADLWNLYHWNLHGPNKILFGISVGLSVLKNISAYILVLLGALGWSITRPTLEKGTVYKIQMIVLAYIVFESLRQISNAYDTAGTFSIIRSLVVLLPISVLNVIVFYWIFSALHENIELLTREKQYEKLLIYRRLFIVLFGVLFIATGILILQLYAAAMDPSDRWQHQAVLADGLPRLLFLLLVMSMMLIWRPHIHSRRLAYFTEIGDSDEMDNPRPRGNKAAPGPQVWGEELDFHDHFSDEDFEDGGAAHLRLDNGIPTFASVQVPSADPSSSSKAPGKAQFGSAPAAQGQQGIEMGAARFAVGAPATQGIPSHETQLIGRPAHVQPGEFAQSASPDAPADSIKAGDV